MLLGALANLATVGNTIAVEKDWVVVIADKNSATLASQLFDYNVIVNYICICIYNI